MDDAIRIGDYPYRPIVELLGSQGEAVRLWLAAAVARASQTPREDVEPSLQLFLTREPEPWVRVDFAGMQHYEAWDGQSSDSVRRSLEWLVRILAGHLKEERSRAERESSYD